MGALRRNICAAAKRGNIVDKCLYTCTKIVSKNYPPCTFLGDLFIQIDGRDESSLAEMTAQMYDQMSFEVEE